MISVGIIRPGFARMERGVGAHIRLKVCCCYTLPVYDCTDELEASPGLTNGMKVSHSGGQCMRSSNAGRMRPFVPQISTGRRSPIISIHGPTGYPSSAPPLPAIPAKAPYMPPPLMKRKSFPNTTLPSPGIHPDIIDELIACTEDPQMSEHLHSHQSRVYIADTQTMHVPPYSASPPHTHLSIGPLSPGYQIPSPLYMLEPQFVPVPIPMKKRRSRGISKKKLEKYKSKRMDICNPLFFFTPFYSETVQVFRYQRRLSKWR